MVCIENDVFFFGGNLSKLLKSRVAGGLRRHRKNVFQTKIYKDDYEYMSCNPFKITRQNLPELKISQTLRHPLFSHATNTDMSTPDNLIISPTM